MDEPIKFDDLRVAIYEISSLLADEPNYEDYISLQLLDLLEAINLLENVMDGTL